MKKNKKIVLALLVILVLAVIWIGFIAARELGEIRIKNGIEHTARDIAEEAIPKYYPNAKPEFYDFDVITYPESSELTDWVYGNNQEDIYESILVNTATKEIYVSYENDLIRSYAKELVMDLYDIDEADIDVDLSYGITLPYDPDDPNSASRLFNNVLPLGTVVDEEFFRSFLDEGEYELFYLIAVDENVDMDLIRKTDTGVLGHNGNISIWQFSNEGFKNVDVKGVVLQDSIDTYSTELK